MSRRSAIFSHPFARRLAEHLRNPLFFNGYALTFSSGATSAIGMAYWFLAARYYPTETVGRNSAAIAALTFLSGLAGLSLDSVLVRFLPQAGRRTAGLVGRVYLISALLAALVAVGFLAGIRLWSPELSFLASSPTMVAIFVLAVVTGCIFVQEDGALVGLRQAKYVAVENTTYAFLKLVLLVVFAFVLPAQGIFFSWVFPVLLLIPAVNLLIFRRIIPSRKRLVPEQEAGGDRGEIFKYAATSYSSYLFFLAYTMLPPLLVIQTLGSKASAYFYLPWTVFTSMRLLIANMGTSLTVEGSLNQSRVREYFRTVLARTVQLLLPIVLVLVAGAPLLLRLFGAEYASQGATLLRLLVLSSLPNTLVTLYLSLARVQNLYGRIILVHAAFALISLGLSYFWLPVYGISGMGAAWLLGQTALALVIIAFQFRGFVLDRAGELLNRMHQKLVE